MPRFSCAEELRELRGILRADRDETRLRIAICAGTACRASGAGQIVQAVQGYIIQNRLQDKLSLQVTGCHGFCEMGPFLLVLPQGAFYTQVRLDDVPRLVGAAIAGDVAEELLYHDPRTGKAYHQRDEIPFFKYQERTLLDMSQKINPTRIHDYIAQGGYEALEQVLAKEDPDWVVLVCRTYR